jgi:hypothetical protein
MTSKYKAVTDNTPQSSSAGNTEAKVRPFRQLVSSDNTLISTETSKAQSAITLITGQSVSEKSLQYSVLLKVVLSSLIKAGLVKKYRVLSSDKSVVKEYQLVFSPEIWTEMFDLKVKPVVKSSHNTAGLEPHIPK